MSWKSLCPPVVLLSFLLSVPAAQPAGAQPSGAQPSGAPSPPETPQTTPLCSGPPPAALAWWPLDAIRSGTVADLTEGHPGRLRGNPGAVAGKVAGALAFDGSRDYLEVDDSPDLNPGTGDFSLQLWLRTDDGRRGARSIQDKRSAEGALRGYHLWLEGGKLGLQLADRAGSESCSPDPESSACTNYPFGVFVADGDWHLVTVTVDRDRPEGGVLYVDGEKAASFDPTIRARSLSNRSQLVVGRRSSSADGFFRGAIDELVFLRRVLEPAEVRAAHELAERGWCKPEVQAFLTADGELRVYGTEGPDRIVLRRGAQRPDLLVVDDPSSRGVDARFALDAVTKVLVVVGRGDDRVIVDERTGPLSTVKPFQIEGGPGDDLLIGGTGDRSPEEIVQAVEVLRGVDRLRDDARALQAVAHDQLIAGALALVTEAVQELGEEADDLIAEAGEGFAGQGHALIEEELQALRQLGSSLLSEARRSLVSQARELRTAAQTEAIEPTADALGRLQEGVGVPDPDDFLARLGVVLVPPGEPGGRAGQTLDESSFDNVTAGFASTVESLLQGVEDDLTARGQRALEIHEELLAAAERFNQTGHQDLQLAADRLEQAASEQLTGLADRLLERANAGLTERSDRFLEKVDRQLASAEKLAADANVLAVKASRISREAWRTVSEPAPEPEPRTVGQTCAIPTVANVLIDIAGNDNLIGGAGNDWLIGLDGDDTIVGQGGADLIEGGPGNDRLFGGPGADQMHGGEGSDWMEGEGGADCMDGDAGSDILLGQAGSDEIFGSGDGDLLLGGPGGDVISGNDGIDVIFGQAGHDTLFGHGGETITLGPVKVDFGNLIFGSPGNDQIFGGDDMDVIFGQDGADRVRAGAGIDLAFGSDGNDVLFGEAGGTIDINKAQISLGNLLWGDLDDDQIFGGPDDDFLWGRPGRDQLRGGGGRDLLFAGADNDSIVFGEDGTDFCFGQGGRDRLDGGDGLDFVFGNQRRDFLWGGAGPDLVSGDQGNDVVFGGDGSDLVLGGDGDDALRGNDGLDVLIGWLGDDEISGNDGNDIVLGWAGEDTLRGNDGADLLIGNADSDKIFGGNNLDVLVGGGGDDDGDGNDGTDLIFGGGGGDRLSGDRGTDLIVGGAGGDVLDGGENLDLIWGSDGGDRARGGDGVDLVFGNRGDDCLEGNDSLDLLIGNEGNDKVEGGRGTDLISGDQGADQLFGDEDTDFILGGAGRDRIFGGDDTDFLFGQKGGDRIRGGGALDVIFGNEDDDCIFGEDGGDAIVGNEGNDGIFGGGRGDFLVGDRGDDWFYGGDGNDWIVGNQGEDTIFGEGDRDWLLGNRGDDRIDGGRGRDRAFGNRQEDTLLGGGGRDFLFGNRHADRLDGGPGNDFLFGGGAADVVRGGLGNDFHGFAPADDWQEDGTLGIVFEDIPFCGEIHGSKWIDFDGDGERDPGEPPLGGVVIYVDANGNDQPDPGEPQTRTMDGKANACDDGAGEYWLEGLGAGTHTVREVVPAGFAQTFPDDEHVVVLAPGEEVEDVDFGNEGAPDLAISATCAPAAPDVQELTLTIPNVGQGSTTGSLVIELFTAVGLRYESHDDPAWTCVAEPPVASEQKVTCSHPGPLARGDSKILILTLTGGGSPGFCIQSCVEVKTEGDANPENDLFCTP